MKLKIIFSFLIMLIISTGLGGCSKGIGKYDSFAQCITTKGVKMYGTEWCTHCKNQKELFGKSFKYIDYVDCDWNKKECQKAGISGYPTWVIDGEKYSGEQKMDKLASLTGCELREELK